MYGGITSFQRLLVSQSRAANVTLQSLVDFSFNLAPNAWAKVFAWLPFTVGASGGFKYALTPSQTLQNFTASWEAVDCVTASPGAQVGLTVTAPTDFANAWAVAGNHFAKLEATIQGHATNTAAVAVQFACNSAANAITVIAGAFFQVTLVQ